MGCFDTVNFTCLRCATKIPVQSKGGSCSLSEYDQYNAPDDVMGSIVGEKVWCPECHMGFVIKSLGVQLIPIHRE